MAKLSYKIPTRTVNLTRRIKIYRNLAVVGWSLLIAGSVILWTRRH